MSGGIYDERGKFTPFKETKAVKRRKRPQAVPTTISELRRRFPGWDIIYHHIRQSGEHKIHVRVKATMSRLNLNLIRERTEAARGLITNDILTLHVGHLNELFQKWITRYAHDVTALLARIKQLERNRDEQA